MFSFFSNYFYREKLDKNVVQPYIYSISKKSNFEELKQIFDNKSNEYEINTKI